MANLGSQVLDEEPAWERMESFAGGEDSYRRATLIDPDQCQHLLNVIVRNDYEARTRAGADSIPTANTPVDAGQVNGLLYFDTPLYEQLLAGVDDGSGGSNIWKFESSIWAKVAGFTPTTGNRLAWAQGVDLALISDGSKHLQTYDGATFTDCGNGAADPPVGANIVTWHAGRMFLSGYGNLNDTIYVSNLLAFGSGQWDKVLRSFRIGDGDGEPVIAMASMQNFQLCVFKSNSVWLVSTDPQAVPVNYSVDQATAVLSKGIGCVGRDAWCAYENDVLFMAQDGIRSVSRMQAAAGQWQLIPPLSKPIQPIINRINKNAWQFMCAKKHQEFAFFFVPLDNSLTNNAVMVWNGVLGKWLGVWEWKGTYVEITRFDNVNQIVFSDITGKVNQWKDGNSDEEDATYTDNGGGYATQVWTRSFFFGDPIADKSGYSSIVRFTAGNALVTMYWVADLAIERTFEANPQPDGDILGGTALLGDFLLASVSPITSTNGLRQLPQFNEAYMRIETNESGGFGWFFLRNVTLGAFVNPLKDI